ncbi:unnamed protein product [Heligmosomoides polygyrus]|uniref:Uncharacterized protein n=1 Tax=Heligmosomoides polygyrus TaxID=6339 RepID=A0A183GA77_HELPZ|nr:unnamed protein product [Heligmosomoides polygyrus]
MLFGDQDMVLNKTAHRVKHERKRTTSDVNDGIEYNKKIRKINKEFLEQANPNGVAEEKHSDGGSEREFIKKPVGT